MPYALIVANYFCKRSTLPVSFPDTFLIGTGYEPSLQIQNKDREDVSALPRDLNPRLGATTSRINFGKGRISR